MIAGGVLLAAILTGVSGGVSMELTMQPLDGTSALVEGRDVRIRIRLRDAATAAPLAQSTPAAWLSPRSGEGTCNAKAEAFLSDSLLARPEVDLNALFAVALNDDATITVLDAEGSFGGSHLLALVELPAPGGDWALSPEGDRLYVAIPSLGRVVAIDTASWRIVASANVGPEAKSLALQPDGAFLWVATTDGVTVVRASDLAIVGRPVRGAGPFALAFSDDSAIAFIADGARGEVALVDAGTRHRKATIATGAHPAAIAYSPLARAATVVHADGSLVVISREGRVAARAAAASGATAIAFAPGGRYAFIASREHDRVQVFDAATGTITRSIDVDGGPEQIVFSDTLAYFQPAHGEFVNMLSIDGAPDSRPWGFPAGRPSAGRSAAAPAMSYAGGGTMFVAHPADAEVYVYREGMAAPSAALRNDGRAPRAVLALRRALREREPGIYETVIRLPAAGPRELTLFVPAARVAHCFAVDVAADPRTPHAAAPGALLAGAAVPASSPAGQLVRMRVSLVDPATREPLRGVDDLVLLVMRAPGVWFTRVTASMESPGTYAAEIVPPVEGIYYVYLECPSRGVALGGMHAAAFMATHR